MYIYIYIYIYVCVCVYIYMGGVRGSNPPPHPPAPRGAQARPQGSLKGYFTHKKPLSP